MTTSSPNTGSNNMANPTPIPSPRKTLTLGVGANKPAIPTSPKIPVASGPPPTEFFWAVWGLGCRAPRNRHATKQSAIVEATRLSELNRGTAYVVLECHSVAKRVVKP